MSAGSDNVLPLTPHIAPDAAQGGTVRRAVRTLRGALRDFGASWRELAATDLAYKACALAILTPLSALGLRFLLSRGGGVVADADVARLFLTTPAGILGLLCAVVVSAAAAFLEMASLMALADFRRRGLPLSVRGAIGFALRRGSSILRVTLQMVVRAVAALIPFALALGVVYLTLLRDHDINYYLKQRPPAFWLAGLFVAVIAGLLAMLVLRTVARWALVFPLIVFENVPPRRGLHESSERSAGNRGRIVLSLGLWLGLGLALTACVRAAILWLVREVTPQLAASPGALILTLGLLLLLSAILAVVLMIFNASLLALLIVRLWRECGGDAAAGEGTAEHEAGERWMTRRRALVLSAGVAVLLALGASLFVFLVARRNERLLVFAHRGASAEAPENSLAAFRTAVAQGADFFELDVQESRDGEVLVVHDSDLMKIAGSPMKIWEHSAAELRSVDIGSPRGAQFRGERVPTLREALAVSKGTKTGVLIELKSYGHDQDLERKVAAIVESSGMERSCSFMSLDHSMVAKMKRLRPAWTVGLLVARALGDPSKFDADFLGVETKTAQVAFIRRAHRAGKPVYVWTVNDPAAMLSIASRGVDGIITDRPALAREVVDRRAKMSDAQRVLLALLVRAGARQDNVASEEAQRP